MAGILLFFHVLMNLVHRDMTRTFDNNLNEFLPGNLCQYTHRMQFGKLRCIVGIIDGTGTKTVADRHSNVISAQDIAYFCKMGIQEVFFIMQLHPFSHNGTTTRNNT